MKQIIFIVEQNLSVCRRFSNILKKEGYSVHAFPTAARFKQAIKYITPELIILEHFLVDGDSSSICDELKKIDRTAKIPVILMSAA